MTFSTPKTGRPSGTKNKHGHSAGRKRKQIAHQSDLSRWMPKRRQNIDSSPEDSNAEYEANNQQLYATAAEVSETSNRFKSSKPQVRVITLIRQVSMNKTLTEKWPFFKCNCSCHLVQSYAIDEADIAIQEQTSVEVSDLERLIDSNGCFAEEEHMEEEEHIEEDQALEKNEFLEKNRRS
jgi:hypothetical protein